MLQLTPEFIVYWALPLLCREHHTHERAKMRHWSSSRSQRQRGTEAAGVMGGVLMLPSPPALVAIVPVFHAMSTRQGPLVAAVAAALAGGAFLTVFLLKRRTQQCADVVTLMVTSDA